jgi:hypothetical protein
LRERTSSIWLSAPACSSGLCAYSCWGSSKQSISNSPYSYSIPSAFYSQYNLANSSNAS